jgi:hypothetical protein
MSELTKYFTQAQKDKLEMLILAMIGERVLECSGEAQRGIMGVELFKATQTILDDLELDHPRANVNAIIERADWKSPYWDEFVAIWTERKSPLEPDAETGTIKLVTYLGNIIVEYREGKEPFPQHIKDRVIELLAWADFSCRYPRESDAANIIADALARQDAIDRLSCMPGVSARYITQSATDK